MEEIPLHCTWDARRLAWKERKRGAKHGDCVGRMYHVAPNAGELYYLRLLLLHVPGATDWAEFKRRAPAEVGQALPTTFREAALRHGLLNDDAETERTLKDALAHTAGRVRKLHELFAESLVWLDVADPKVVAYKSSFVLGYILQCAYG